MGTSWTYQASSKIRVPKMEMVADVRMRLRLIRVYVYVRVCMYGQECNKQ